MASEPPFRARSEYANERRGSEYEPTMMQFDEVRSWVKQDVAPLRRRGREREE